jgi:hypothetical protein
MILHPALVQQRAADEQMALIDAAVVGRKRRARQREAAIQRIGQRIRHRADIAGIGAVEGGAVFEEHLPRAGPPQPIQRGQAVGDSLGHRRGARFQRDHHGVGIRRRHVRRRHADHLHRAHAAAHQHRGKIGGAGEVVGDAAQQHDPFSLYGAGAKASAAANACACVGQSGRVCPTRHAASAMSRRSAVP